VSYRVLVDSRAARSLQKLRKEAVAGIDKVIGRLSEDPRPPGVKMLRSRFKRDGASELASIVSFTESTMRAVRCGFSRSVIVVKSTVKFALASSPRSFAPNGVHSLPPGRAFLALLGEISDEAIDLTVRCTTAGRQITAVLTDALATKLHGDPHSEYCLEWTEEEQEVAQTPRLWVCGF
jgi:hypothetical protein